MFQYAVKRALYSLLIMVGVLIVTFVLFRVAAGDPASTVLGKNPSAEELENMRDALGSNKPLFWGGRQHTEIYAQCTFASPPELASAVLTVSKDAFRNGGVELSSRDKCVFTRLFEQKKEQGKPVPVYAMIYGNGTVLVDGKEFSIVGKREIELVSAPEKLVITVPEGKKAHLKNVSCTLPYSRQVRQQLLDGQLYMRVNDKKYRKELSNLIYQIM